MKTRLRQKISRLVGGLFAALLLVVLAQPASAQEGYLLLNLVTGPGGTAVRTDPNLSLGWGMAASATSPWWIADPGSGNSTIYDGFGHIIPLVVTVPPLPGGTPPGSPTGIVYNGTSDFVVSSGGKSGPARFIFAGLDGSIQGWSPAVSLTSTIIASTPGILFTGLANGSNAQGNFLYAADYGAGEIDMIDGNYDLLSQFTDSSLPANYAPFGIQNINGQIYVTFGPGNFGFTPGAGAVDVFDTSGNLVKHLVSGGPLLAPWGLAMAPKNFGQFSGDLLVGNLFDGHINAFDPSTGAFIGTLADRNGTAISIPGLWAIGFGNGHGSGQTNALYFASGAGLFGVIYPRGTPLH
ncbi:MAG TPA: TIGR03118 family protein [Terriglobia bacterium]|nr:TIGR03118 family protein [Terriglobia bacterium]